MLLAFMYSIYVHRNTHTYIFILCTTNINKYYYCFFSTKNALKIILFFRVKKSAANSFHFGWLSVVVVLFVVCSTVFFLQIFNIFFAIFLFLYLFFLLLLVDFVSPTNNQQATAVGNMYTKKQQ